MTEATSFDELPPLHPHVIARPRVVHHARPGMIERGRSTALDRASERWLTSLAVGGIIAAAGYWIGRVHERRSQRRLTGLVITSSGRVRTADDDRLRLVERPLEP